MVIISECGGLAAEGAVSSHGELKLGQIKRSELDKCKYFNGYDNVGDYRHSEKKLKVKKNFQNKSAIHLG